MLYLIHFDKPICHARHYVGCTNNLLQRLQSHAMHSSGARILQVARERGIEWQVARLWKGTWSQESTIKAQKNSPQYCPLCKSRPRTFDRTDCYPLELITIPLTSTELRKDA